MQTLTELYGRLLSSIRELLDGYETVLGPVPRAGSPPPRSSEEPQPPEVTISAGPFGGASAMRDFERALLTLPGVREVAVRGYEGIDRAILDVNLQPEPGPGE